MISYFVLRLWVRGFGIGPRLSEAAGALFIQAGGKFYSKTSHPRLGRYRNASQRWIATSQNEKAQDTGKNSLTASFAAQRGKTVALSGKVKKSWCHQLAPDQITSESAGQDWRPQAGSSAIRPKPRRTLGGLASV